MVLDGIYAGWCTPVEARAAGALLATISDADGALTGLGQNRPYHGGGFVAHLHGLFLWPDAELPNQLEEVLPTVDMSCFQIMVISVLPMMDVSSDTITQAFADYCAKDTSPRTLFVLAKMVEHLHAFAKETK
ncbi:hypothetical protein [Falsihalocynthiibacter arcticus]|uniref:Uncharacterized protein n=1 Tax=Falsihalocynthiibacter arcticus TaxID=1579316 RepID=A0A126V154_9RHOB|nr:hypothetical protein [Falsihalocynthiibacter arcticus]AML52020.1 hypothetical protein RC74_12730 [Falsihalocynthiibacter arcticus]